MLVLVGKSCSGKNTIQDILVDKYEMDRVVTCTTRPIRKCEKNNISYHFLRNKEFDKYEAEDMFAETADYHVATGDIWRYGSLKEDYEDSDNKVIILNPKGLKSIRDKGIPIYAVQLFVPDTCILQRIKNRNDGYKESRRRLEADKKDFKNIIDLIDISIPNGDFRTPEETAQIIFDEYQNYLLLKECNGAEN